MAKPKPISDFHLTCKCFLQVQKGVHAQGMEIRGLSLSVDRGGNGTLVVPVVKHKLIADQYIVTGWISFNFCPFCGKQIAMNLAKVESDEKQKNSKSS